MKLFAIFLAAAAAAISTTFLPGMSSDSSAGHESVLVQASVNIDGNIVTRPLFSIPHDEMAELDFGRLDGQSVSMQLTPDLNPETPFVTVSLSGQQDIILPVTGELQQIEVPTKSGKAVTVRLGLNLNNS